MPLSRSARAGRLAVAVAVAGAGLAGALTSAGPAAAANTPYPDRVTLMGSLMSEAGCPADWDESCTATDLAPVAGTQSFSLVTTLPAGSYEYKVRLNGSWSENYGAGGAADGANVPLVLQGPAAVRFTYDHATHLVTAAPAALPGVPAATDRALAQTSLREDLTRERFYFAMADRFENGDTRNDLGGYPDVKEKSGFDPTAKGWYHGGDLRGMINRLDYIKGLGTTALWLTPSFKNQPVQGTGANQSAGYHGYWITDFTQIDPHLGTNAELEELVAKAHAKGMKVFFDIITNHTADVIQYAEGSNAYVPKATSPYRDADGNTFDDRAYAGGSTFPTLDPARSFPYTPVVPATATVKVPAWLNDPRYYHNRGDALFNGGESDEYGDFSGLDDLFTEQPAVVKGMEDIYKAWVDFGVDGFRIDTVKHVDMQFWQQFAPAMQERAAQDGNPRFFEFGEVYDTNPQKTSSYTTEGKLQATLDFGFQAAATAFAQGKRTDGLRGLFANDDWYTDADSNAYSLPTFLGNHDMGRIGLFLQQGDPQADGDELLERDELAHTLMYLTRGQPVVYYGDEQGFTGDGGDQLARQDMFPSKIAVYNDDDLIGTSATTARSNFDTTHPLYQRLRQLSVLRTKNPTLADGAQIDRYADSTAGVYAFSRISDADNVEYVVAANNATTEKTVTFDTFSPRMTFRGVWPLGTTAVRSDAAKQVTVTVPPLSAVVYKAATGLARTAAAPAPVFTDPAGTVGGRAEIGVTVPGGGFDQVTFAVRPVGTADWRTLGTDDNAPYRVFDDVRGLPKGTLLEYRAVVRDSSGNRAATSTYETVGEPKAVADVIPDPGTVTVAGSLQPAVDARCAAWQPSCAYTRLTKDAVTGLWSGTFTVPAGSWQYKIAYDGDWTVNFGADGQRNGGNIALTTGGGPVTFTYDPRSHLVTTSEATAQP